MSIASGRPLGIRERAERLRAPAGLPQAVDWSSLSRTLEGLGAHLLREVSEPTVLAVFRLAIAEAARAPEVAKALDSIGIAAGRAAKTTLMARERGDHRPHIANPARLPR